MARPEGNGKTVLISGINGYIASCTGLGLLKKGYTVRGTARSVARTEPLRHGAYAEYADRFEVVAVPYITKPGAFDEAVKGVYAIIHAASPVDATLKTWDDFIPPAEQGSISILQSAQHAGPQLEVFVFVSSTAAVIDYKKPLPQTFTDADWNDSIVEDTIEAGDTATTPMLYRTSKVMAERASSLEPPFKICAVNPTVVFGPPVQPPPTPEQLNLTLQPIWLLLSGRTTTIPPGVGGNTYVDVRDVADVQIWCVECPSEAANRRFVLANRAAPPQAMADLLRKAYPHRKDVIPVGNPGEGYVEGHPYLPDGVTLDCGPAQRALGGREWVGFEKSVLDMAMVFERWL